MRRGRARAWNVTLAEGAEAHPCDGLAAPPAEGLWRAIDVAAPAPVAFRRICQLKVVRYGYDWADNLGRRPAAAGPRGCAPRCSGGAAW